MLEKLQISSEQKSKILKGVLLFFVVLLILTLGISIPYSVFAKKYQDKILPNVYIGVLDVGNLTVEEAKAKINVFIDSLAQNGVVFSLQDKRTALYPVFSSFDGGVAKEIIAFDVDSDLQRAFAYGHGGNLYSSIKTASVSSFRREESQLTVKIDEKEAQDFLREEFLKYEKKSVNAQMSFVFKDSTTPEIEIKNGVGGEELDYDDIMREMKNNLAVLKNPEMALRLQKKDADINQPDKEVIKRNVTDYLATLPFTLVYQDKKWELSPNDAVSFLALTKEADGKIVAKTSSENIKRFLRERIAPKVNIEPRNSKFYMIDGKMQEFQGSLDGLKLDEEKNAQQIIAAFDSKATSTIALVTEKLPAISSNDVNSIGINDLLGVGKSSFAGSPKNRRHNIRTGANSVNGTLIKPGETFSLLKTLGEINGKTGYLQELVIKENKTIPEYGGGLCQVGTTVFRGATEAGLPIVERRNHSYRVSYYEPAGTDATIYDPSPDFKFLNDTGDYILIQSKIVGDSLSFEFWGTKDGRKVEKAEPTIYNIVKPGPTKIVEVDTLKPGEKKCTEKAHNGADAFFDYKVTYPASFGTSTEPIVKKTRFSSHYVPWREVCLVGKAADGAGAVNPAPATVTPVTVPKSTASSTPAALPFGIRFDE